VTGDHLTASSPPGAIERTMRHTLGEGRVATLARLHLESGGGRVRARLGLESAARLRLPPDVAVGLAAASELLHNASLIHDDIQDRDTERRGRPALWVIAGTGPALCAGDLMISAAYAALATATPGPALVGAIALLHEAVGLTISGQAADLSANPAASAPADTPSEPAARPRVDFAQAVSIAAGKSGPLIALPVRLALLMAEAPGDALARQAADALSVGYQIADDLADLPRDRAAGRLNAVLALEGEGWPPAAARADAIAHGDERLRAAEQAAHAIPRGAGRPLADLVARVRSDLTEVAHVSS